MIGEALVVDYRNDRSLYLRWRVMRILMDVLYACRSVENDGGARV
jgi:hypothetical protein